VAHQLPDGDRLAFVGEVFEDAVAEGVQSWVF